MGRLLTSVALLALLAGCRGGPGSPNPSDSAVAAIINQELPEQTFASIPLGHITVVDDRHDVGAGQINSAGEKIVGAWARAGLVSVQTNDLTQQQFSFDNWFALSGGARKQLTIEASPAGRLAEAQAHTKAPRDPSRLYAEIVVMTVDRIIETKPADKATNKWLIVKATIRDAYTAPGRLVCEALAIPTPAQQNAMFLLRYDAFAKHWSLTAEDLSAPDGRFSTNNVATTLAAVP